MQLSNDGVIRLHRDLIAAGIPVVSVNSLGIVQPASLQAQAQPIIDAFVDTPDANQKAKIQLDYKNAHDVLNGNNQLAIIMRALIKVLSLDNVTIIKIQAAIDDEASHL